MRKCFERLRNLKGTKHYVVIHTNKNVNITALKGYIACFNICLYKRKHFVGKWCQILWDTLYIYIYARQENRKAYSRVWKTIPNESLSIKQSAVSAVA